MNACHEVDRLVTPFVDGECATEESAFVTAHLRECVACRERVDAEATTRRVLHAHMATARRTGAALAWRPRVWRLGRPALPAYTGAILLVAAAASGLLGAGAWLRPVEASAIGVIGDSTCQRTHRSTTPGDAAERACVLRWISRGAHFVLMTDADFSDQQSGASRTRRVRQRPREGHGRHQPRSVRHLQHRGGGSLSIRANGPA